MAIFHREKVMPLVGHLSLPDQIIVPINLKEDAANPGKLFRQAQFHRGFELPGVKQVAVG